MINNFSLSLSLSLSSCPIFSSLPFSLPLLIAPVLSRNDSSRGHWFSDPIGHSQTLRCLSVPLKSSPQSREGGQRITRSGDMDWTSSCSYSTWWVWSSLSLSFPPSSLSVFLFDPLSLRSSPLPLFLCVHWFPMRWLEFSSVSNNCLVMRERETWRNHQLLHTHTRRVCVYVLSIPLNVSTHSL